LSSRDIAGLLWFVRHLSASFLIFDVVAVAFEGVLAFEGEGEGCAEVSGEW